MDNTIVTPQQVVEMAFGGVNNMRPEEVSQHTILAAERTFVVPVVGAQLLEELHQGQHAELLDAMQCATALYTKRLMLPSLAAKVGVAGVVRYSSESYSPADSHTLKRLLWRTKADADALLDKVVEIIEAAPEEYPSYSPAKNVRNRVRLAGGVVWAGEAQ